MIMIWVPRIYGDIGSMFTNWKNISYEEIPEFEPFRKLAADAGVVLNRKRPFGIKKGYNNAWANPITKRIVIGDKFLQRPVKQQKALLGHELTHIKENHYWRFLIAELVVPTLVAFPLFLTKSTPIIKEVSFYAVFFMTFVLVNWHNEYSADRGGARIAGSRVAMSSLLLAIVPKKSRRVESASHPSICSRIIKLRRMKL